MLSKNNLRELRRCSIWACMAVGLLAFQAAKSSAQTPIYTYGGGISGTSQFTDNGNGVENLVFTGSQTGAGSLGLAVIGCPAGDPTLTFSETINNQSTFSWGQYSLAVSMPQTFTITSASVTAPPGWAYTITQPTLDVMSGNYDGSVVYYETTGVGASPVTPSPSANDTLDFDYTVDFNSTTSFSLTESAMVSPVPEPATYGLLLIGVALLCGRMLYKHRQTKAGAIS